MTARDETAIEQAVEELTFAKVTVWDLLSELAVDKTHAWDIAQDVAFCAGDDIGDDVSPEELAGAAAMIGMALGVQAERVRQRRHGLHGSEVVT
jgi:hypothetical protein